MLSTTSLLNKGGNLDAIYDVTIGYSCPEDQLPENEKDLADGKIPKNVHFHVKR